MYAVICPSWGKALEVTSSTSHVRIGRTTFGGKTDYSKDIFTE